MSKYRTNSMQDRDGTTDSQALEMKITANATDALSVTNSALVNHDNILVNHETILANHEHIKLVLRRCRS